MSAEKLFPYFGQPLTACLLGKYIQIYIQSCVPDCQTFLASLGELWFVPRVPFRLSTENHSTNISVCLLKEKKKN